MSDDSDDLKMPDRLSVDPSSPYHNAQLLERGVRIKLNGVEKTNVDEYCISEGWVKVTVATSKDRRGHPMTMKLKGTVEPFLREPD